MPKTQNEILYEKARAAIDDLFADQSVSREDAIVNLETLISEIETLIRTLEADAAKDEE